MASAPGTTPSKSGRAAKPPREACKDPRRQGGGNREGLWGHGVWAASQGRPLSPHEAGGRGPPSTPHLHEQVRTEGPDGAATPRLFRARTILEGTSQRMAPRQRRLRPVCSCSCPPCPRARSHRPAAVLGHRGLLALSLKPLEAATDPGAAADSKWQSCQGHRALSRAAERSRLEEGACTPKARGWAGPVSPGVTRLKRGIGSVHMQMGTLRDRAGDSLSNTSQLPAQAGRTAVLSPDPLLCSPRARARRGGCGHKLVLDGQPVHV